MDLGESLKIEFESIAALNGKVYPVMAPQKTVAPYLTYEHGKTDRNTELLGTANLLESQYQIEIYHSSYLNLMVLKKLVLTKINSFNLRNLAMTGPYCQQLEIINDFETYENLVFLYKGIIEFDINYEEE